MAHSLFIEFLGHSIHTKALRQAMRDRGLNTRPSIKGALGESGHAYRVHVTSREKGIVLTFEGYTLYRAEFGEPLSRRGNSKNELILLGVDFHRSRVALPFG